MINTLTANALWILGAMVLGIVVGVVLPRSSAPVWLRDYRPDWVALFTGVVVGLVVVGLVGISLVALGQLPGGCEAQPAQPQAGSASTPSGSAADTGTGESGGILQAPTSSASPALVAQLDVDGSAYLAVTQCLVRFNNTLDVWIKIGAIAAAFLTTVASQQKWTLVGVASGALVVALTGAQAAFPLGDRANFYRVIEARTDRVLSDVRLGQLDMRGFEVARTALEDIKADAAKGPSGVAAPPPTQVPTPTMTPTPRLG